MPYIWCAHPLIEAGDSFEVRLPSGRHAYHVFPHDGAVREWPHFEGLDLTHDWIPRGRTLKLFVTGLEEGWCELRLPGETLRFEFDVESLPALGIWYNHFGFPRDGSPPFRCIAIEPSTAASARLDALEPSAYPAIPPGGASHWALRLSIS